MAGFPHSEICGSKPTRGSPQLIAACHAEGKLTWIGENWHIVAQNNTLTKIVVGLIVFLPAYGVLLAYLQKRVAK